MRLSRLPRVPFPAALSRKTRWAVAAAASVAVSHLALLWAPTRQTAFFNVGQRIGRAMGQGIATTQFYVYGRRHFTQTGWLAHSAGYPSPDPLDSVDLSERVYVVTGANGGIGRELTKFLASKGAKIYMVCRDEARASVARAEIAQEAGVAEDRLVVVVADVALQRDVRRAAASISAQEARGIDGLVCNAGALLNERTLTDEGVEVTFASHLAYGAYLMTKLLEPSLRAAGAAGREPRVVHVSSGGMYNTPFPAWNVAASLPLEEGGAVPAYDGQLAYAYAKRGQVLLCERWAELEKQRDTGTENKISYVSVHPGWVSTKGVMDAYGDVSKYLEPMRDMWQGTEGLCWLCVTPASNLESGAFYLDRSPQVKHMAGIFFSEGSFTKNSEEEVDAMFTSLDKMVVKNTETEQS